MPEVTTRKAALAVGLTQYFTGKPCPRGHNGMRQTVNGWCVRCRNDQLMKKMKEKQDTPEARAKRRRYEMRRIQRYPVLQLKSKLRIRLHRALNGGHRLGSAVRDVGCTMSELRNFIESQFHSGMTWQNWGEMWELDHKQSLSSFDLSDRDQFLKAVHWSNLQPLLVADHRAKSATETTARR